MVHIWLSANGRRERQDRQFYCDDHTDMHTHIFSSNLGHIILNQQGNTGPCRQPTKLSSNGIRPAQTPPPHQAYSDALRPLGHLAQHSIRYGFQIFDMMFSGVVLYVAAVLWEFWRNHFTNDAKAAQDGYYVSTKRQRQMFEENRCRLRRNFWVMSVCSDVIVFCPGAMCLREAPVQRK